MITNSSTPTGYGVVADFDNPTAAGYSWGGPLDIRTTSSGDAAQPPGDSSAFLNILGGSSATLIALNGIDRLSFYMGSPDTYNYVSFFGDGGYVETFIGAAIMGLPVVAANGDQSFGRTVYVDFGKQKVTAVTFGSFSNSFEIDDVAVRSFGVPEPATWALMIAGFGLAGAALRRRQGVLA